MDWWRRNAEMVDPRKAKKVLLRMPVKEFKVKKLTLTNFAKVVFTNKDFIQGDYNENN